MLFEGTAVCALVRKEGRLGKAQLACLPAIENAHNAQRGVQNAQGGPGTAVRVILTRTKFL
jgi:hypothetical protein